ncbi:F-box protein [Corchorus olitorius]|uniref:F-box protein n=1 Tax=Corchorus olitorius TaxID=93759 RepID=A0A1R3J8N3_9ROSI|nr:F-box protein [Corchorus olitorius]
MSKLKSLLCDAARFKIEEIKLEFDFDLEKYPYPQLMSLPHVLFNSDSLTSLELTMKFMLLCEYGVYKHHEPEFPIEFPNSIWRLPSLKTLHIEWFEDWEQLILPGCPVLEELILQCRKSYKTISIASASIQRLTLECFFLSHCNDLEVNCSNLQSLNISDWRGRGDIQVCDLYSLVEANIDIDCTDYYWESPLRWVEDPPIPEILEGIRHVKSLTLTSSTLEAIQFLLRHKKMTVDKLPIFYNLTHLELELNGVEKELFY